MKTVLMVVDCELNIVGTHPLMEKYYGESCGIGQSVKDLALNHNEITPMLEAMQRLANQEDTDYSFNFHFDSGHLGLSGHHDLETVLSVTKSRMNGEILYMVFGEYVEGLKEFTGILQDKERLHIESINVLNVISGMILNEPSSRVAARQSLDLVAKLFKASIISLRLYSGGRAEFYVGLGLPDEYFSRHQDVPVHKVPDFLKIVNDRKAVVDENPAVGMGYLFPDVNSILPLQMMISVPIQKRDTVIGFISLGFDKPYKIVKESLDILENVVNEFHFLIERNEYYVEILNKTEKLKKLNLDIVTSLTGAIETRDSYTNGHSIRVALYAVEIARNMGWDDYELNRLNVAGLLHDIGKVGIPDAVLLKPEALTHYENEIMRFHPDLSANIVSKIENFQELVPWVRHHHENYNGQGYPYGLKGNEIPIAARIIAVADAYDAMTSDRPYRKALQMEEVQRIFSQGAGQQWDKEITEIAFDNLEVIYRDTSVHYNIPEKLDDFRRTIFNISLMSGLYLYEHIYHETERHIEEKKNFTVAMVSIKVSVGSVDGVKRKLAMNKLIEMSKTELHYPILISRYDYYQLIVFAPLMNKSFIHNALSRLQMKYFKAMSMAVTTSMLSYPEDASNTGDIFDRLLHQHNSAHQHVLNNLSEDFLTDSNK